MRFGVPLADFSAQSFFSAGLFDNILRQDPPHLSYGLCHGTSWHGRWAFLREERTGGISLLLLQRLSKEPLATAKATVPCSARLSSVAGDLRV
jgi:hypothetical protein